MREYFGDGDECHMAYHFPLMPRMYMAIAQEERHPITEILAQTPDIPETCQWAIFLRNHDELTLEMVTSKERDYMYNMYAADKRSRINLGIRRRLAPLLENDPERIKLMNYLLFSMPGTPVIYYGDEIGLGDNIHLGDRDGVRTPMQWMPERNAGFSRADPQRLYMQPIMDPIFGYEAVNVEAQERAPSSLLNWTRRILAVRKSTPAFGRGTIKMLRPSNRKILAYLREYGEETILCVANLARSAQPAELDLSRYKGRIPIELMGRTPFPPIADLPYRVTLAGYDFLWFRLPPADSVPATREETVPRGELPVLVLFDGWASLFRDRVVPWRIRISEKLRNELEAEMLPAFISSRRWFASKAEAVRRVELADHVEWKPRDRAWLVSLARAESVAGETQTYFLPMTLAWEESEEQLVRALGAFTIAQVRQQARIGVLADAFGDESFVRALVAAVGEGATVATARGKLRFRPTSAFAQLAGPDAGALPVATLEAHSSNTVVTLGDRLFVKGYRRLQPGANPEVEIGRYLTESARFANAVPVAGSVEYESEDGRTATVALIQGYVQNQGSVWAYTVNYLERFFDDTARGAAAIGPDVHGGYVSMVRTLGKRTAELHTAFARTTGDAAFDPVPVVAADVAAWTERVRREAAGALDTLALRRDSLPEAARANVDRLLAQRDRLLARIDAHAKDRGAGTKTRLHGDYHLGQVLLVQNDVVIIDFEGEPSRTMVERTEKLSPLKDVAGMLRSFAYAMHAAVFNFVSGRPDARETVERAGRHWQAQIVDAFLGAYDDVGRAAGLASARAEQSTLLELFILEKAVYELAYEVGHRPEWVHLPVSGLLDILGDR